MYIVSVRFKIADGHAGAFREAVIRQSENSLARETACRQFDVCFDPEDPNACLLYEKYDDRAAFEQHLASEHFRSFDQAVGSWVVQKDVSTWVQVQPEDSP